MSFPLMKSARTLLTRQPARATSSEYGGLVSGLLTSGVMAYGWRENR
jgi:hypothetical protein